MQSFLFFYFFHFATDSEPAAFGS